MMGDVDIGLLWSELMGRWWQWRALPGSRVSVSGRPRDSQRPGRSSPQSRPRPEHWRQSPARDTELLIQRLGSGSACPEPSVHVTIHIKCPVPTTSWAPAIHRDHMHKHYHHQAEHNFITSLSSDQTQHGVRTKIFLMVSPQPL